MGAIYYLKYEAHPWVKSSPQFLKGFLESVLGRKVTFANFLGTESDYIHKVEIFEDIECVIIHSSPIKNVYFLKNLTKLETLDLIHTDVEDISCLAELKNLKHLDLYAAPVEDVSFLKNLTKLESLKLNGTEVKDISALEKLTSLKELSLSSTDVEDFRTISNYINLEKLDLISTKVIDLNFVKSLNKLKTIQNHPIKK